MQVKSLKYIFWPGSNPELAPQPKRSLLGRAGHPRVPGPGAPAWLTPALVLSSSAVFEEPEDPSNRSFFSEIISSISDVKFSHSGRYIMTRDYLTVKVWDLNMENRPIETYQVSVAQLGARGAAARAALPVFAGVCRCLPPPGCAGQRGASPVPPCRQVHDYLRSKLCSLYENDCIFDKFECVWNGSDR